MRYYFCILFPCIFITSEVCGAEPEKLQPPPPQPNTLYSCKESGQQVYTNTKLNNKCKGVVLSHSRPPIQTPSSAPTAQTPTSFPKVSETTQKARDADRKNILEQEMATEQKSLERAKKELVQQEAKAPAEERYRKDFAEHMQPFKDKVAQHERNIQALRKEMGNIK